MVGRQHYAAIVVSFALLIAPGIRAAEPNKPPTTNTTLDLAAPFGTRAPWRLTATQGPGIDDPIGMPGDKVPAAIELCLRAAAGGPCDAQLQQKLRTLPDDDLFAEPHSLNAMRIVRPRGPSSRPLLLVETASLHSGNGDQLVLLQALAYDPAADRFRRVYRRLTGRNNNQEVRYIGSGPLAGDIISAEPTEDAPFAFWITVNALSPAYAYAEALRYRSATRYADGNPLAVIDSEMPAIQQRLGLWRPGAPLPLPASKCKKPHLVRMELWCD